MAETECEVDLTTEESPLKKKPKIEKWKKPQKTAKTDAAKKRAREMFATPRYNISDSDSESEVKELKKELAQLKVNSSVAHHLQQVHLVIFPLLQIVADILKHRYCVS